MNIIQSELNLQKSSSLLVLANCEKDFILLRNLLSKYFPSAKQSQIHVSTKYYSANIQIIRKSWPQPEQIIDLSDQTEQQIAQSMNPQDKQSLLIMLVNDSQSFPPTMYDFVINKYNPENFILIVNTKAKITVWKDEDKISNEVNNFIEVIKEDLESLNINPPQRVKTGLLADSYEDGSIVNLLQLIETTSWPYIKRKTYQKQQTQAKQIITQAKQVVEVKEEKYKAEELQEELNDEQLQSQMNAFESLMGEMLNLKQLSGQTSGVSDLQRKRKAQDLMKKLVGGWM